MSAARELEAPSATVRSADRPSYGRALARHHAAQRMVRLARRAVMQDSRFAREIAQTRWTIIDTEEGAQVLDAARKMLTAQIVKSTTWWLEAVAEADLAEHDLKLAGEVDPE